MDGRPSAVRTVGRTHVLVGVGPRAVSGSGEKGLTFWGFGLCSLVGFLVWFDLVFYLLVLAARAPEHADR